MYGQLIFYKGANQDKSKEQLGIFIQKKNEIGF